ncbi:MAG: hypothetical protein R3F43_20155 [bacterium]
MSRPLVTSRAEDGTEGATDLAGWSTTRLGIPRRRARRPSG